MRVRLALLAGGLLLLGGLLALLGSDADEQQGSNRLTAQEFVATVPPGGELCQGETVPAPTGAIRMTIATFGRPEPALEATLRRGGRVLARGVKPAGWDEGVVELPLPVRRPAGGATQLCLRATTPVRLAVGGERVMPAARAGGRRQGGRVAIVYLPPGSRSWAGAAGDVAERFGYGRAGLLGGHWTLWVAVGLMVAAAALAVRSMLAGTVAR